MRALARETAVAPDQGRLQAAGAEIDAEKMVALCRHRSHLELRRALRTKRAAVGDTIFPVIAFNKI
jgi:hypothetical protein